MINYRRHDYWWMMSPPTMFSMSLEFIYNCLLLLELWVKTKVQQDQNNDLEETEMLHIANWTEFYDHSGVLGPVDYYPQAILFRASDSENFRLSNT